MSLESGRKLGFIASMIAVLLPIIMVILYALLFLSLISGVFSTVTGGTSNLASSFSVGVDTGFAVVVALALAGIVMFLIGMHRLGEYYNEPGIFKNALYGFIINIVGVGAVLAIILALVFAAIFSISSTPHPATAASPIASLVLILGIAAGVLAINIVSALLYKRAFDRLAEKSGVHDFNTTGTLYLIGTILTIIFVGGLIMWVAFILAAEGFHSLKPKTEAQPFATYSPSQPPATANSAEKKYCVYCGEEISLDSLFCPHCGKPVQK